MFYEARWCRRCPQSGIGEEVDRGSRWFLQRLDEGQANIILGANPQQERTSASVPTIAQTARQLQPESPQAPQESPPQFRTYRRAPGDACRRRL